MLSGCFEPQKTGDRTILTLMKTEPRIKLPNDMLPSDGRFGSGPSRVRKEAVTALAETASGFLGTSHRRSGVRSVVNRLQTGIAELFGLSDDWEVVLGNGGATTLWDSLGFSLIRRRSQHLSFGEFSSKFAKAVKAAPHLEDPQVIEAPFGTHPLPVPTPPQDVDFYALTHNETSTGVQMPLQRPEGVPSSAGLVAVDATSGAGGLLWQQDEVDIYYFSPQKCFAADGGLWIACCSPAALERVEDLSTRWRPASLDMRLAIQNSRKNQTYNTPALATVSLTLSTVDWMNSNGGLPWAAERCEHSAQTIYGWAEASEFAQPFVSDLSQRSRTVATIDITDEIPAGEISAALRENGIVDTESYRALGRNQLRIALFPAIPPEDIAALCDCVDYIVERLPPS